MYYYMTAVVFSKASAIVETLMSMLAPDYLAAAGGINTCYICRWAILVVLGALTEVNNAFFASAPLAVAAAAAAAATVAAPPARTHGFCGWSA